MSAIIQVQNLVKRYNKASSNAVDDISFDVQPGEFFTFLGPNGAGKTTTISILTTTLAPTNGRITIAGHDVATEADAVRRQVGIIFQKPSLDQNLTAEENVRLHAILYGLYPYRPSYRMMPKAYKTSVDELASILGIEKEINRPIKTLSGGMKRKLEIIRSLIHHPKVLFLDEPTVGLDPLSRRSLWEYLTKIRSTEDTTIFLTTHYLEEAEAADTVCVINQGKIVANGTPAEVKSKLVQEYVLLTAADQNRLEAELKQRRVDYTVAGDSLRVDIPSAEAVKLVKVLDTPLTKLVTHAPSLEDAYLKIVETHE